MRFLYHIGQLRQIDNELTDFPLEVRHDLQLRMTGKPTQKGTQNNNQFYLKYIVKIKMRLNNLNIFISRYSSRALQIRFEPLLKEKKPGEGAALEAAARAASSSLPYLLSFGRVKEEEVRREMSSLKDQDLELRESEGLAYPLAVCRKV